MTTVGYGDIVPHTDIGKLVAVTCAFVGILFMALPIAILGSKVTLEYAKLEGKSKVEKEQKRLAIVERRLSKTGLSSKGASAKIQKVRESKINAINARTAAATGGRASPIASSSKIPSPTQSHSTSISSKEVELADVHDGDLGADHDTPHVQEISAKAAMRNLDKKKENFMQPADQRKLAEAVGEIEARYDVEHEGKGRGLFGKRANVTTDAMELVITRLVDELTDEDIMIGAKDRKDSLEELMRHLKGLSDAVKADLEADFRRTMLLVESADVLLHAATKAHKMQMSIAEAVEHEVDGEDSE